MDIYSAWKILCTYRVMYSVHVRRMYRANLGVCSPDRGETRAGRGEEDDFYVNICETLRRHDDAAHIRRLSIHVHLPLQTPFLPNLRLSIGTRSREKSRIK